MAAERKIGNATYRVEQLGAREQQRILIRLGKVAGPALGGMAEAFSIKDEKKRNAKIGAVFGEALAKADVDEVDGLIVALCEKAQVREKEGAPYEGVIFDHHFSGNLKESWQVARFVFEVNFRDFFKDGGLAL